LKIPAVYVLILNLRSFVPSFPYSLDDFQRKFSKMYFCSTILNKPTSSMTIENWKPFYIHRQKRPCQSKLIKLFYIFIFALYFVCRKKRLNFQLHKKKRNRNRTETHLLIYHMQRKKTGVEISLPSYWFLENIICYW